MSSAFLGRGRSGRGRATSRSFRRAPAVNRLAGDAKPFRRATRRAAVRPRCPHPRRRHPKQSATDRVRHRGGPTTPRAGELLQASRPSTLPDPISGSSAEVTIVEHPLDHDTVRRPLAIGLLALAAMAADGPPVDRPAWLRPDGAPPPRPRSRARPPPRRFGAQRRHAATRCGVTERPAIGLKRSPRGSRLNTTTTRRYRSPAPQCHELNQRRIDSMTQPVNLSAGADRAFPSHPRLDRYFPSSSAEDARTRLMSCVERGRRTGGADRRLGGRQDDAARSAGRRVREPVHDRPPREHAALHAAGVAASGSARLGQPHRDREEGDLRLALVDHLQDTTMCPAGALLLPVWKSSRLSHRDSPFAPIMISA